MKGTVKSKDDVERLFREGRRSSSYMFVCFSTDSPSQASQGRCAFIAGKKLGCAPLRSRCKRVMRAAAAELVAPWKGVDIAFVARKDVATAPHEKVLREMSRQLSRLGIEPHER